MQWERFNACIIFDELGEIRLFNFLNFLEEDLYPLNLQNLFALLKLSRNSKICSSLFKQKNVPQLSKDKLFMTIFTATFLRAPHLSGANDVYNTVFIRQIRTTKMHQHNHFLSQILMTSEKICCFLDKAHNFRSTQARHR